METLQNIAAAKESAEAALNKALAEADALEDQARRLRDLARAEHDGAMRMIKMLSPKAPRMARRRAASAPAPSLDNSPQVDYDAEALFNLSKSAITSLPEPFTLADIRKALADVPEQTPLTTWQSALARLRRKDLIAVERERPGNQGNLLRRFDPSRDESWAEHRKRKMTRNT